MARLTIQKILEHGYSAFEQGRRLPLRVRKAAKSMRSCRTSDLGGHVQACPDGHVKRQWYNSCKHRMCPQCAFIQVERWLVKQRSRLLNCDHYHVIFTIPDSLRPLWRANVTLMSTLLFRTARDTLFELLGDKKYLGAQPGLIASLHSWARTLMLHPHLHVLVTGGGCHSDGRWIPVRGSYLLPFDVVRTLFRGKFLAALKKALASGQVVLPDGCSTQQLQNLFNKLGRKKWNVHLRASYAHGFGVLTYLARYVRGGPISNKRIVHSKEGQVKFHYGREKVARMELSTHDFLSRLLQHVPPRNAIRVRSYGLYHHSRKEALLICREALGQPPIEEPEFLDWQTYCSNRGESHPERCPVCGKRLISLETFPRMRYSRDTAPPPTPAVAA